MKNSAEAELDLELSVTRTDMRIFFSYPTLTPCLGRFFYLSFLIYLNKSIKLSGMGSKVFKVLK